MIIGNYDYETVFLADRTYLIRWRFCYSVCRLSVHNVLWLNGAS